MNLSNEQKAKVFALYIGGAIMTLEGCGEIIGILAETDPFTRDYTKSLNDLDHAVRVDFGKGSNKGNNYGWFNTEECQLILKPLSKISDEDAISVAKLMPNYDPLDQTASDEEILEILVFDGKEATTEHIEELPLKIYDFLRSKGYALPYMGIDLFESGIAIEE